MRVVGLVSGGKDSCYNLIQCVKNGHELVALLNLHPPIDSGGDELDSYMYQTVGHQALESYSEAMDLPLFRHPISGKPVVQEMNYEHGAEDDEVEDLYRALRTVKEKIQFDAISVGAILSNYQRTRAENVCQRLGIKMLCYLWERDQLVLLREMIDEGIEAIIIKVAAMGLNPHDHLGKTLAEMYPILIDLNQKYGINVCGEGGEYETLTLDCPLFKNKLVLEEKRIIMHSEDAFAPVGYLKPLKVKVIPK